MRARARHRVGAGVIAARELGCEALELVGQRGEEILSSHLLRFLPLSGRRGDGG